MLPHVMNSEITHVSAHAQTTLSGTDNLLSRKVIRQVYHFVTKWSWTT